MLGVGPVQISERIVVFCLLAGVTFGLTVDSVSARFGVNPFFLPKLFKSKSLSESSLEMLANGRDRQATDTARLAVLKQPLSVEALSVLARSSAVLKPQMSSGSLAQAATLGWRDVAVQTSVIETAAAVRNWDAVGPRLVALTRLGRLGAVERGIFITADAREYAPKVAHAFLEDGTSWLKFSKWLLAKGREADGKYFLRTAPTFQRDVDCFQFGLIANEFVRKGEIDFAAELVNYRCRSYLTTPSHGLSIDQNFGDSRRGPFQWKVENHPGVRYNIKSNDGRIILEVVNTDPLPRLIASKIVPRRNMIARNAIYSSNMSSGRLEARSLDLSFSCINGGASAAEYDLVSDLNGGDRCRFVRVKIKLPTGRFQLWGN